MLILRTFWLNGAVRKSRLRVEAPPGILDVEAGPVP